MQTCWIKIKNSIKDEDNPKELHKTKNEEATQIGPENKIFCSLVSFVKLKMYNQVVAKV